MATNKTYKCPYCDKRMEREKLITHIAYNHEEMIPEGFTARRVVFNSINNKTHGTCVICGKETDWNEESGHYNRYCNNPKCKETARKAYEKNMLRVHGTTNLFDDAEFQQKALAGRKISGKYKFSDGGVLTYTGSYEKNLLEFADKCLNIHSKDIMSPGPTLEYQYQGKIHKWVTDQYWIPWNLIIEVKDGGDNPNNRPMKDSRDRTLCKEIMITDLGTYNYIRLTNNQFPQLLEILMEIKKENMDDTSSNRSIIKIYEQSLSEMNHYINKNPGEDSNNQHGVYFTSGDWEYQEGDNKNPYKDHKNRKRDPRVNHGVFFISYSFKSYVDDESIEGFALADDIIPSKILVVKDNKLAVESVDFLSDRKITIYKYLGDKSIRDIITTESVNSAYFYEALTGKKLFIWEQPILDYDNFAVLDPCIQKIIKESYDATLWDEYHKIMNEDFYFPVTDINMNKNIAELLISNDNDLCIMEDVDGYFVYNTVLNQRSKSYRSINDISANIPKILKSYNIREAVYHDYSEFLLHRIIK